MSAMPTPTVTREDLDATVAWWRGTAPKAQQDWLEAGAPNEQQARQAVDQMIARGKRIIAALKPATFEVELALLVKRQHIAAVALARGGVRQVRVSDLQDE